MRVSTVGTFGWLSRSAAALALAIAATANAQEPIRTFQYDVNGDATSETVKVFAPVAPTTSTNGTVQVRAAGTNDLLLSLPPSTGNGAPSGLFDRFGFAVQGMSGLHGSSSRELAITSPIRPGVASTDFLTPSGLGGVTIFNADTGAWRLSIPAPAGARLGLGIADIPDQDLDNSRDLLVAGASVQVGGQWKPRTFVYSGSSGRLLTVRPESLARLVAYANGEGVLYLPGDLDQSGSIDTLDLTAMLMIINSPASVNPDADLDHNGVIDAFDVQIQITGYLAGQRSIASAVVRESDSTAWDQFITDWAATYTGTLTVSPSTANPPPDLTGSGTNPLIPRPFVVPCSCSGPSGLTGLGCSVSIANCPGALQVGQSLDLDSVGSDPAGTCAWSVVGPSGVVSLTGNHVVALAPGFVAIHLECSNGTCCGCAECLINVFDPAPECHPTIHLRCCAPAGDTKVSAGGQYRLFADVTPSGGHFTWTVTSADTGTIDVSRTRTGDWPNALIGFGAPGVGESWADHTRKVTVTVVYQIDRCPPAVSASCTYALLVDSDHDGLLDSEEATIGTNPNLADTDGDGWPDGCEVKLGSNPLSAASIPAQAYFDSDKDGLSDAEEICRWGTDPNRFDTDGDGVSDFAEVTLGLSTATPPTPTLARSQWLLPISPVTQCESLHPSFAWSDPTPTQSGDLDAAVFKAADKDGDLLVDAFERQRGLDPLNPDTDGDGVPDGIELLAGRDPLVFDTTPLKDTDNDGIADLVELYITHTDPLNPDTDGDGLPDGWEVKYGLNPREADSDGNGIPDGSEDLDGDGLSNLEEYKRGLNPAKADSDGDGISDSQEILIGANPLAQSDGGNAPTARHWLTLVATGCSSDCQGQACDTNGLTIDGQFPARVDPQWPDALVRAPAGKALSVRYSPAAPASSPSRQCSGCQATAWNQLSISAGCGLYLTMSSGISDINNCLSLSSSHFGGTALNGDGTWAEWFYPNALSPHATWSPYIQAQMPSGCESGLSYDMNTDGLFVVPEAFITKDSATRFTAHIRPVELESSISSITWSLTGPNVNPISTSTMQLDLDAGTAAQVTAIAAYSNHWLQDGVVPGFPAYHGVGLYGANGSERCKWYWTPTVPSVDLWVDSGNTLGFARSHGESAGLSHALPGKIIFVNDGDADGDRIPDWVDGARFPTIDTNASPGVQQYQQNVRSPGMQKLVPLVVRFTPESAPRPAAIAFEYSSSDPVLIVASRPSVTGVSASGQTAIADQHSFSRISEMLDGSTVITDGHLRLWSGPGETKSDARLSSTTTAPVTASAYIPSNTKIPLAAFTGAANGEAIIYIEAVAPSITVGGDVVTAHLYDDTGTEIASEHIVVTAVKVNVFDLSDWGPQKGVDDEALPSIVETNLDRNSTALVDGALADGASACLIRLLPANVQQYIPDLTIRTRANRGVFNPRPNAVTKYGGFWPTSGGLPPLPCNAETLNDYPPTLPDGAWCSPSIQLIEGKTYYVPPENFNPLAGKFNGVPAFPASTVYEDEIAEVSFDMLVNGQPAGGRTFLLRRPPVILVHGIYGNGTFGDKSTYWARPSDDFVDLQAQLRTGGYDEYDGFHSRVYAADWRYHDPTPGFEWSAQKGYDVNFGAIPQKIRSVLRQYRAGSDSDQSHNPQRGFFGLRYAATRADLIGHSQGGQLLRTYVSQVSCRVPRRILDCSSPPVWTSTYWNPWDSIRHAPLPNEAQDDGKWWYLRDDNWGAGDIRRMLTLDSVYKGAPLGNAAQLLFEPSAVKLLLVQQVVSEGEFLSVGQIESMMDQNFPGHHFVPQNAPSCVADLAAGSVAQRLLEGANPNDPLSFGHLDLSISDPSVNRGAHYPTGRCAVRWRPIASVVRRSNGVSSCVKIGWTQMPAEFFARQHLFLERVGFIKSGAVRGMCAGVDTVLALQNDFARSDAVVPLYSQLNVPLAQQSGAALGDLITGEPVLQGIAHARSTCDEIAGVNGTYRHTERSWDWLTRNAKDLLTEELGGR